MGRLEGGDIAIMINIQGGVTLALQWGNILTITEPVTLD